MTNKHLSDRLATFSAFCLIIIVMLLLAFKTNAQSYAVHKRYNAKELGKQCHAVHKQKTAAQKWMSRIKYARKRHNSEGFSTRERHRKIRKGSL